MARIDAADKPGRNDPPRQGGKAVLEKRRKRLELLNAAKALVELQLVVSELIDDNPAVWTHDLPLEYRFTVKRSTGVFTHTTFTVYRWKGKYRFSYFSPSGTEYYDYDNISEILQAVKWICGIH